MPKKFPDKIVKTSKPNLEEQFRLQMEKELQEFKDNHELERKKYILFYFNDIFFFIIFFTEMEFPPNLSNVERCFVHQVAQEMGLKTKSYGKNQDRFLTVFKHSEQTTFEENIKYCSLESMDSNLQEKIEDYLLKNPLNKGEIDILEQFSSTKIVKDERSSKLLLNCCAFEFCMNFSIFQF